VIDEAELFRAARPHGWVTLSDIAVGLDVSASTLSRVLNHRSVPGHELLARMAVVFGEAGFAAIAHAVDDEVTA